MHTHTLSLSLAYTPNIHIHIYTVEQHKTSLLQSILEGRGIDNALIISEAFPENFRLVCMYMRMYVCTCINAFNH